MQMGGILLGLVAFVLLDATVALANGIFAGLLIMGSGLIFWLERRFSV